MSGCHVRLDHAGAFDDAGDGDVAAADGGGCKAAFGKRVGRADRLGCCLPGVRGKAIVEGREGLDDVLDRQRFADDAGGGDEDGLRRRVQKLRRGHRFEMDGVIAVLAVQHIGIAGIDHQGPCLAVRQDALAPDDGMARHVGAGEDAADRCALGKG